MIRGRFPWADFLAGGGGGLIPWGRRGSGGRSDGQVRSTEGRRGDEKQGGRGNKMGALGADPWKFQGQRGMRLLHPNAW